MLPYKCRIYKEMTGGNKKEKRSAQSTEESLDSINSIETNNEKLSNGELDDKSPSQSTSRKSNHHHCSQPKLVTDTARHSHLFNNNNNSDLSSVMSSNPASNSQPTTTFLVLSPAPTDLSMASTSYHSPVIFRAQASPTSSTKTVIARIPMLTNNTSDVDNQVADVNTRRIARLVRYFLFFLSQGCIVFFLWIDFIKIENN